MLMWKILSVQSMIIPMIVVHSHSPLPSPSTFRFGIKIQQIEQIKKWTVMFSIVSFENVYGENACKMPYMQNLHKGIIFFLSQKIEVIFKLKSL